ncbi:MAG: serine/threonine-protein kinase [Acidobacteriota bacterium]
MPEDRSQLETLTLNESSNASLNETTLPEQSNLIGKTLDGRYLIEKELGKGGVGAVYLARDRKLHDKHVVIKVLLEKSFQNSWVVQKFQQEAEALARINHPGVVKIFDSGSLADGKAYFVMEFINGTTLRSKITPEGLPLSLAAELIKQIGRALAAAHDRDVFHRDLKPENIMLQSFGSGEEQVKIIDFGIAKLKDSLVAPSTVTGATAGTVSYMAPEQLSGRPVSSATDNYAFGAIAYEMVTGRKPFNPETGFELLEMQRAGVRIKPSDLRPSLSEEANQIILRALNFDAEARFFQARELGDQLARALGDETGAVDSVTRNRGAVPPTQLATDSNPPARQTADLAARELSSKTIAARFEPAPVNTLGGSVYSADLQAEDAPARRPWLKVVAGLLLIVLIGAGAIAIWKRDRFFGKREATPAPAPTLPERSLAYSLNVQKLRDGKPYQDPFDSSGQEIFENGWKFRMNLFSPQEGYLYLLNEGPAANNETTYNVLFPEPQTNGGSPRVTANQNLQTAWMRFDEHQGTEKFWLVWSAEPVKEFEAVTGAVNEKDKGEIKDAAAARKIRDFLTRNSSPKPEIAKNSAKKQTTIKGRGDLLASFIELEHH